MKKAFKVGMMPALAVLAALATIALAGEKTITLPKGTKAVKMGADHFKFKLPDGRVVEVKNLNLGGKKVVDSGASGIIGDCGIYDPSGKKTASGGKGTLVGGPKPAETSRKPPKKGVAAIDDEITWAKIDDEVTWGMKVGDAVVFLPATLRFQVTQLIDPDPPHAPVQGMRGKSGLSPQPDPPGASKAGKRILKPGEAVGINPQPEPPMPARK